METTVDYYDFCEHVVGDSNDTNRAVNWSQYSNTQSENIIINEKIVLMSDHKCILSDHKHLNFSKSLEFTIGALSRFSTGIL